MSEVFQPGFGARLKSAREAMPMAVADVANKLKLTARQIEAIEEEDMSHLPNEVFVRGFVRNYARLVGVQIDSLLTPVVVEAVVSETITAPNAGLDVGSGGVRRWLVYPLLALFIFLLLVAGLYQWLRQGEDSLISALPDSASEIIVSESDVLATPALEGSAPIDESATITPLILPSPVLPSTNSNLLPDAVTTPPTQPQTQAQTSSSTVLKPDAPEAIAASSNAVANVKPNPRSMRFEPSQDAWIQVVDAKGNRFSRLVRAGTSESFSGEPPFRLVIGEAALVKLTYNGHSIDLAPFIGQKVARLTLE